MANQITVSITQFLWGQVEWLHLIGMFASELFDLIRLLGIGTEIEVFRLPVIQTTLDMHNLVTQLPY